MDITNFSGAVRLGSTWPWVVDVEKAGHHENEGVCARVHYYGSPEAGDAVVELRRKGHHIGLITRQPGTPVPAWWQGSELLWEATPHPEGNAPALSPNHPA